MEIKKEDLRVRRTREAIQNAFKKMVCQMPYEKISVKGLADRAQINRNTFYLHYETIEDMVREIQSEYTARYLELIKEFNYIDHQADIVRTFFTFMEAQDEFFQRITCDSRFDTIREGMQRTVMAYTRGRTQKTKEQDRAVQNIIQTYSGVTLYLYRQWVADGRKIPLEKMIQLATALMEHGMQGLKS